MLPVEKWLAVMDGLEGYLKLPNGGFGGVLALYSLLRYCLCMGSSWLCILKVYGVDMCICSMTAQIRVGENWTFSP